MKTFFFVVSMILLFICCAAVSLSLGSQEGLLLKYLLSLGTETAELLSNEERFILFQLRLPRLLLAFSVGAILSLAGVTYQTLFSNPIASPYTLGVSGGAALGFVLSQIVFPSLLPVGHGWIFSVLGGLATLLFIFPFIAKRGEAFFQSALIFGILVSLFTGSLLFFLQYFMDPAGIVQLTAWYFGTLSVVGYQSPLILFFLLLVVSTALFLRSSALDLLLVSSEYADSYAVRARKLSMQLIVLTTVAISFVISYCGPIGFIGLITPHFARHIVGASHQRLIPFAALSGGLLLVLADICARFLLPTQELPVGLMTTLLGAPIMAMLLFRGSSTQ